MAFEIDPVEFLAASRKANAAKQSRVSNKDFSLGSGLLFQTSKNTTKQEKENFGFEDLGQGGLEANTATNQMLKGPLDEIKSATDTFALMDELEVRKYGAEKQAEEQRRREALMRAQCQKAKKKSMWGSIGAIGLGLATGNYGAAIMGGANLLGNSGGC